jgi:type II secretion system protein N
MALAALALFVLSLFVFFSGADVERILKVELKRHSGVSFVAKDFSKSFPLGFKAKGVSFSGKGGKSGPGPVEIADVEDLRVSLDVIPLIIGKKKLSFLASRDGGTMEGKATLGEDAKVSVRALDFAINGIAPIRAMGLAGGRVSGVASFEVSPEGCPKGSMNLDVTGVDVKGLKSPLPLMLFGESLSASLAMETTADCIAEIKGLFIEGYLLNAKLNGVVRILSPLERSVLDMKIEIFIKPGVLGNNANKMLLSIMKQYKRSSGHYLMSLKGTIGNPSIMR